MFHSRSRASGGTGDTMGVVTFFWLNFHLPYTCRHSGMCCSSGWPIPVERSKVPFIEEAIARDTIPLRVVPWLTPDPTAPEDVGGVLGLRENGHCVFFETGRPGCAVHGVKPSACVHFPYVCLIDPRGVRVNLSHFCPTATALLFEHRGPIEIVEGPNPLEGADALEGLDARDALPPARSETQLMSWNEFTEWERFRVSTARVEEWNEQDLVLFERARASVPAPWSWQPAPEGISGAWWSGVAPVWHRYDDVCTRYVAAKIFGSWSGYLGNGIESITETANLAAAVLRVECARQCLFFGRALDKEMMSEAVRQSDLLLVHYAEPSLLAGASTH